MEKLKMTKTRVATVIGLGSMGRGAAHSLLRAGIETHAFDVRPEALDDLAAAGGHAHQSSAAAVTGAEVVFIFVVNADQAEDVLFGPEGAVAAARPGTVFAVSVTQAPARAEDQARRLLELGMLPLDAPVSGGSVKALAGEMSIMASGPAAAFERAAPYLDAISARVFKLGDAPGAASRTKMTNQLLAGVPRAAAGEMGIMASGPAAAFERAAPYLDAISARVFKLGDAPGAASRMKMINQLLAGVHIAAAAEAMVLAAASDMDLNEVIEVISDC